MEGEREGDGNGDGDRVQGRREEKGSYPSLSVGRILNLPVLSSAAMDSSVISSGLNSAFQTYQRKKEEKGKEKKEEEEGKGKGRQ